MKRAFLFAVVTIALFSALPARAADPDWDQINKSAVDLLQRYVRIESIDPPANTAEAANFVKHFLEENGIEAKLYASGPNGQTNLVARVTGRDRSKKPLLLLNHLDVVPVDRKAWKFDPFAAVIQNGEIWGRGTMDMKGIGVEQMVALATLKKAGITPARDIVMLSTADEENNGTYGIRWMIDNHFADIDAEYVLDEGGFGAFSPRTNWCSASKWVRNRRCGCGCAPRVRQRTARSLSRITRTSRCLRRSARPWRCLPRSLTRWWRK
jgi:hypothetical protein